ncbi:hypothetical protein ACQKAJ_04915 [Helicobacter pylori]
MTTEKERLARKTAELENRNAALTEKTADLKTENDKLNHQVIALNKE